MGARANPYLEELIALIKDSETKIAQAKEAIEVLKMAGEDVSKQERLLAEAEARLDKLKKALKAYL